MTEFYANLKLNDMNLKTNVRKLLGGVAALVFGAAFAVAPAGADGTTKISRASPFANCTADNAAGQPGTNYPDSEIEPQLAVNPAFTPNMVAGWQQDRWSDGGSRGLVAGVSVDDGATWRTTVPPKVTLCSGGSYERASDPWVSIGPTGRVFFMSLAFMNDRPDGGLGKNAMLVSRSLNGGFSWSNPIPLIVDTDGQIFNDKNSVTADPLDGRYVYATWDRLQDFTLPSGNVSGAPAAKVAAQANGAADGVVNARVRFKQLKASAASRQAVAAPAAPITFRGPTYFVRSANGGNSWEPAKEIYDPGGDAQTINNIVEVLRDGTVADFFTNIASNGDTSIGIIKSVNKGRTFKRAKLPVPTVVTLTGTQTPDSGEAVRDANILFDVAVDRQNGNQYLVWQDGRFAGIDQVAFSMSTDDGDTWSAPVKINMTPDSVNPLRNQAFIPSVEVGANHEIVVTYYDFRFDTDNGKESTDYFAVFCTPNRATNCALRGNWGDGIAKRKDIRITDRSFDMLDAPVARGHFLGDYMGIARKGQVVMPAFGIADSLNHTSINTKPIRSKTFVISGQN
jgi:hypothetical protein